MVMHIDSTLHLKNDSTPQGEGWWEWSIWLEGSPEDMAKVKAVTYRLHPTFPRPVVEVTDARTKFRLSSEGWGEFLVSADVHMGDGTKKRLERWLELRQAEEAGATAAAHRPSIFLSYSIADSPIMNQLSDALSKEGIEVRTADQTTELSEDPSSRIGRELGETDAVIALVSDPPSSVVEEEALTALRKNRFVMPVVVSGARISDGLSGLPRYELTDSTKINGLATSIAARLKDYVIRDDK